MAVVNPTLAASPPTILRHPGSQQITFGSTAFLFVRAVGFQPLSYQWYLNGTNSIRGAINAFLEIPNIQLAQSGTYPVILSNAAGSTISQAATISVVPSLQINMVPAITVIGGVGLTYRLEYMNVIGATNTWLPLDTITLTNSKQFYPDYSAIGQPQRLYRSVQLP